MAGDRAHGTQFDESVTAENNCYRFADAPHFLVRNKVQGESLEPHSVVATKTFSEKSLKTFKSFKLDKDSECHKVLN